MGYARRRRPHGRDLDDLPAGRDDLAGGAVDDRLGSLVRDVRPEDEHEFIAAHARVTPSYGIAPLTSAYRSGAEPKGNGRSLARALAHGGDPLDRPLYPRSTRPQPSPRPTGDPVPASTILLLETDPRRRGDHGPVLTALGYTVTRTTDLDEALAKVAEHQLVDHRRRHRPRSKTAVDVCREIRGDAGAGADPGPVRRPDRRRRGADRVPRGRRRRRHGQAVRRRELEARVEALLLRFQRSRELAPVVSADGLTLARPRRTVAVFSPKGGVGTTTIATNLAVAAPSGGRSGRADRPRPAVRPGRHAPQPRAQADARRPRPRRRRAPRARAAPDVRDPPRQRAARPRRAGVARRLAELITAEHVDADPGRRCSRRTTRSSSTRARCSTSARCRVFEARRDDRAAGPPRDRRRSRRYTALLDYLNETGSIGDKSTFVLNNMFAREILKLRDIESGARHAQIAPSSHTTRSSTSRP